MADGASNHGWQSFRRIVSKGTAERPEPVAEVHITLYGLASGQAQIQWIVVAPDKEIGAAYSTNPSERAAAYATLLDCLHRELDLGWA